MKTLPKFNIASRDQQREEPTRIKQNRLANLPNTPLKKSRDKLSAQNHPSQALQTILADNV
ncbi:hypothetical protein SynA1840_02180 [Synechococcus sp. A18-40]|nr:hypothetical protein SynA1840_02180 [Synechococcus sp. A18-40]